MPYIRLELDAFKKAQNAAGCLQVPVQHVLGGLATMWHTCWSEKTDTVSAIQLSGIFAFTDQRRLVDALVAFGFLERHGEAFRIRGADRYLRIPKSQSEAGKARAAGAPRDAKGRLLPVQRDASSDPASIQRPLDESPAASQLSHLTTQPPSIDQELSATAAPTPPRSASEHAGQVGETEPTSSELLLQEQDATAPKPRKRSDQESFAEWFEGERKDSLGGDWHPDNKLSVKRLNAELEWVKEHAPETITAAARLYLLEPRRRNQSPPCSLLFFSRDRETYLHAAKTRGAA